jgi:hypothetical protein
MGFFKYFFGENKTKWASMKKNTMLDFKIVTGFLMVDNISYEQYMENWRAYKNICETDFFDISFDIDEENIKPSKTFKENYKSVWDLPIYHSDYRWFYIGYPDVSIWLSNNYKTIENLIQANESKFFINDVPTLNFFRFVIDMYVREYGKLELSV